MLGQVMMNLSFVLALAGGLLYVVKKWKQPGTRQGQLIKTLSHVSLGAKEKILLVEVLGEKVLIGVTPNQMSVLKSFDKLDETHLDVMDQANFTKVFREKALVVGEDA